jgi:ATP-binding cassette, subfamily B, bacterial PglK
MTQPGGEGLGTTLRRFWRHLRRRRRRQFVALSAFMVLTAFLEVGTLGALVPFLGVITAPESVWESSFVQSLAGRFGIDSASELVLPLTVLFIGMAVLAGSSRLLQLWVGNRLAYGTGTDLSTGVYQRTLYQPYSTHIGRNTSEVISSINKVNVVIGRVLVPVPRLVGSALILLGITVAVIVIDPVVAIAAGLGFGGSYLVITSYSRKRLRRNGIRIAQDLTQVVKAQQEGLGGIRDVLLDGTQQVFSDLYSSADGPMRRADAENAFIAVAPKYFMEAVGMVLIAGLAYFLSLGDEGVSSAIPVLGAVALGAQRLLPALQEVFSAWAQILGSQAALEDVIKLLDQPLPDDLGAPAPDPLSLEHEIRLAGLRFRYTDDGPWVLTDVDLAIPRGARVGFVGSTGSGKSTLLDLVMGLLDPTEGQVLIDGEPLESTRLRAWQRAIAHVPQHIFLADTSWAENIAFGVEGSRIDMDRVKVAAQRAHVAEFIEQSPEGYRDVIGERGVRLSGGQRQRVGIARALYKQASVLVFDEATSALDNTTEQSVMASIDALDRDLTVLLVAHRLTTVQRCDFIVELDGNRIVAQGTYDELLEASPTFRRMAEANR